MYEIQLFDEKQTEGIYKALTDTQGWGLNRTSNAYSYEDTFPGFIIMDEQGKVEGMQELTQLLYILVEKQQLTLHPQKNGALVQKQFHLSNVKNLYK